jgi:hypothetical protein
MNNTALTEDDYIKAIIKEQKYWEKIPYEIKTKSFTLKAMDLFKEDLSYFLQFLPDELKDDKEIVIKAVTKDGLALSEASDRLKNNREVALAAFTSAWQAFIFFGKDLVKELKEHGYYGMKITPIYLKTTVMQDQLKLELTNNVSVSKKLKL